MPSNKQLQYLDYKEITLLTAFKICALVSLQIFGCYITALDMCCLQYHLRKQLRERSRQSDQREQSGQSEGSITHPQVYKKNWSGFPESGKFSRLVTQRSLKWFSVGWNSRTYGRTHYSHVSELHRVTNQRSTTYHQCCNCLYIFRAYAPRTMCGGSSLGE